VSKDQTIEAVEKALSESPEWAQYLMGAGNFWEILLANGSQVIGVGLAGWLLATWFERRHLKSMSLRETPLQNISLNTLKQVPNCAPEACTLLIGSVVVAHDYFRTLIIILRRLIGGNISPYERLVQRGRREALIRLKEEAGTRGIDKIINVRFTTSAISGKFLHAIELVAYGTGVKTK
jgi:uncharacterized protein YbjQ (UPF0145 family)